MHVEELENRRLLSIALPSIAANTFNVTAYGVVADGTTNNATNIQKAIAAATKAGGGTVEFPAAAQPYESGPITLATNINFQVDAGAELQALSYSSYPGAGSSSVSNFITAKNLSNFEITGGGTIDGNGAAWWAAYNANNSIGRPRLINITGSNTILIQGLTLQNSPMFHIAFGATNTVTINDITINSADTSPNTDGIDPAGQHYLIENCSISTGDDNIAVKPQDVFCGDITVTDCFFGVGHGLSVGGETNDGLNGMTVSNCVFYGTTAGIRLKAARGEGGLVQNVSYSNLTMTDVEYPININSYYNIGSVPTNPQDPTQTVNATTPIWKNISISNVTSTWDTTGSEYTNSYCGIIWGLPEEPVNTVTLANVQLSAKYGMDLDHVRNVSFDSLCHITAASGGDEITQKGGSTPYDVTVTASNWTDSDIGSPVIAGQSVYDTDTGTWTNTASGTGIAGTSDQFNFAWTNLWVDSTISTKINAQGNSNFAAEAGVMIRESTAANAAFAAVVVTPGSGVMFQWRASDGANVQSATITGQAAPLYVRVTRSGNTFTGFYSSTGTSWTQIGSAATVTMATNAIAGIAASANSSSATSVIVAQSTSISPVAPTATITPIAPNPITTAVANITITFTQPITGFDLTDLSLSRDGFAIPLTGATLSTSDGGSTWILSNLSSLTTNVGTYLLQLTAAASGIGNSSGENLSSGATMSWTMNTLAATGAIRLIHDNLFVDCYLNSVYQYSFESASVPQLFINSAGNTITIDLSSGNLNIPVSITGGSLNLTGAVASDAFTVASSQITHGGQIISIANLQSLSLTNGTFTFNQDISGPALQIGNNASALLTQDQHLASLTFAGNGQLDIASHAIHLAETGPTADSTIFAISQAAYGANWTGSNIISSAGTSEPANTTGIGYFDNGSQITIARTWYGDANLDGQINADDLSLIMLGQPQNGTRWQDGNFNYDNQVNADDWMKLFYSLAYSQGQPLSPLNSSASVQNIESSANSIVVMPAQMTSPFAQMPIFSGNDLSNLLLSQQSVLQES